MFQRCTVWLVVLSTSLTSLSALTAVYAPSAAKGDVCTLQSDVPPIPASTDGRRSEDRGRINPASAVYRNHRWLVLWRSFWLMIALAAPSLVWSLNPRVSAEEFFLQPTRLFEEIFEDSHVAITDQPLDAEPPRYAPAPPKLPGCWLSGGRIPIAKIEEYPRIPALDCDRGLFDTWRPNLFGKDVPEEWDFQNLINTDRPDFTDATFSVGKDVAVLETGYTFRKTNSGGLNLERRQLPESLLRIGVTDELELRIKWIGYVMTTASDQSSALTQRSAGTDDLQLGFKYELAQQNGWRPMLTFVGGAVVPSGTNGVSANQVQPFANLVYGWGRLRQNVRHHPCHQWLLAGRASRGDGRGQ
jgi:hypothetical protein